jgi:predicted ABC-type ATPase
MFAGPNGSGKSTIKSAIDPNLIGIYVNPDEIELQVKELGLLDLSHFEVHSTEVEILDFFKTSTLLEKNHLLDHAFNLTFSDNRLIFSNVPVNSYFASVASDFIRKKLLQSHKSFTTETVMSSPDKIELLKKAQEFGYRTY